MDRGDRPKAIFEDDKDRHRFVKTLEERTKDDSEKMTLTRSERLRTRRVATVNTHLYQSWPSNK